jgi:cyclopropane-fatty-acyl-phospholipid synthase
MSAQATDPPFTPEARARRASPAMHDRVARAIALRGLGQLRVGELQLIEPGECRSFGQRTSERPEGEVRAIVHVNDPRFYRELLRGSAGLARAYMDGLWDAEDLVALTRLAALNVSSLDRLRRALAPVLVPVQRWSRVLRTNTTGRARRQIAAHYDLGNDLFASFLDPTMMYSCAYFEHPEQTLHEASQAKLERVCRKLDLTPCDHVLEIGTGWGGFALHAAAHFGCRVTTATISREQHALARERVRAAGLGDRVEVVLEDYRELRGRYDKLVSIEMIEAVGWRGFDRFFRACSELLEPRGLMLLQAITIDDRAFHVEKAGRSFINTYIFPGGCLPSMEIMRRAVSRRTDMRPVDLEDITPHYAETLRHWRENFLANRARIAALGYDERFLRLWELYLAYCEGGFRERRIGDVQLLLAKPGFRGEGRSGNGDSCLSGAGRA